MKLLLLSPMLFLFIACLLIPTISGYGSTIGAAETLSPGTHSLTLYSVDNDAYYKVSCSNNQYLNVTLNYDYPSHDLDIALYDPSQAIIAGCGSPSPPNIVEATSTTSGYYYIHVYRAEGSGDAAFSLQITLTDNPGVPGFEILFITYGLIALLGLILYLRNRKITLL
jgi:hypothetical protein